MPADGDEPAGPYADAGPERQARRHHRPPALLDRLVASVLEQSNRPLSAYDIVRLGRDRQCPLLPAQVYRVLARLVRRGRVHRIELLSAYLLAAGDRQGYMVCRRCQAVESFAVSCLADQIDRLCADRGFSTTRAIMEVSGLCAECKRGKR